jgi:hypothetical protein
VAAAGGRAKAVGLRDGRRAGRLVAGDDGVRRRERAYVREATAVGGVVEAADAASL